MSEENKTNMAPAAANAAGERSGALRLALAGNPNCGKTTLFNSLTGSNGYVGNWPGVTVEKKEATWVKDKEVIFTDLPGIYSLSPYSPEEVVSRDYLIDGDAQDIVPEIKPLDQRRILFEQLKLEYSNRELISEAQSQGVSRATILRWNERWIEQGLVMRTHHGRYKKVA